MRDGWENRNPYESPDQTQGRLEVTLILTAIFIVVLMIFLWYHGAFKSESIRAVEEFQDLKDAIEVLKSRKTLLAHETDSLKANLEELESRYADKSALLKAIQKNKPLDYFYDFCIGSLVTVVFYFLLPPRKRTLFGSRVKHDDNSECV